MSTRFIFLSLSVMLLLAISNVDSQEDKIQKSNLSVKEIQSLLDKTTIDTKGLTEKVKLKVALEFISDTLGGKAPIYVDKAALAREFGADAPSLLEEEVRLAAKPAKVTMRTALTQL